MVENAQDGVNKNPRDFFRENEFKTDKIKGEVMKILIIRNFPSYMDVRNNTYNIQEVGLAKALVRKEHICDIVFWTDKKEETIVAELTPMMQQYFEIKNQYKDHILFYRLGDFYEMFDEDEVKSLNTMLEKDLGKGVAAFAMDLTDDVAIEDLLCTSDICISDYSSLVFEYSLFVKPMIFLAHDLDDYFDWRGFYYDYKDFVPGPIFKTSDEVMNYIKNIDKEVLILHH